MTDKSDSDVNQNRNQTADGSTQTQQNSPKNTAMRTTDETVPMNQNENGVFEADWGFEDTQQETGVQVVEIEGLGKAQVTFVDFGAIEASQQAQSPGQEGAVISAEMICKLVKSNFITPDFSNLTPEKVRTMKPTTPPRLLDALMNDDDVDIEMNADGSATVTSDQGNQER